MADFIIDNFGQLGLCLYVFICVAIGILAGGLFTDKGHYARFVAVALVVTAVMFYILPVAVLIAVCGMAFLFAKVLALEVWDAVKNAVSGK